MNKILLLSYPRSGNSLIKYFLKRSTNTNVVNDCLSSTANKKNIKITDEFIKNKIETNGYIFKEHYSENCTYFTQKTDSLILVVRNYTECIFRHNKSNVLNNTTNRMVELNRYINNIKYYDSWSGKKVILYYEDLIVDFEKYYSQILNIVDVDINKHNELFKNLEFHKNECLKQYDKVCGSHTKGKKAIFHSKNIPPHILNQMKNTVKSNKNIYNKYLLRY